MRKWITGAVTAFALAACTGTTGSPATTTTPPETTATAPTTTTSQATTTSEIATTTAAPATTVPEAPIPDTSGDDWNVIIAELYDLAGWLYEHPDVGFIEHLAVPGSEYDTRFRAVIQEYQDNGWHDLPDGRPEIREVALQGSSGGQAVVLVVDDYDGAVTVDEAGTVVKQDDDRPPFGFLYTLQQDDSGRWRFNSTENLGPIEGFDE